MCVGADETKLTREALKWPYGEFEIPNEVYDAFGAAGKKGQALEDEWTKVQFGLRMRHLLPIIHCVTTGQLNASLLYHSNNKWPFRSQITLQKLKSGRVKAQVKHWLL